MAYDADAMCLFQQFLDRYEAKDPGRFFFMYEEGGGYEYVDPETIKVIPIRGVNYRVCPTVTNAKHFLEIMGTGTRRVTAEIEKIVNSAKRADLSLDEFADISARVYGTAADFMIDVLRYATLQLPIRKVERFQPLAFLTSDYMEIVMEIGVKAQELYAQKLARIDRNVQEYRRMMDDWTARRVAESPTYVHIEGRIRDGLFGPRFDGTVTATPSMTEADIARAYADNRSSERISRQTQTRDAKNAAMAAIGQPTIDVIETFVSRFIATMTKNPPPFIFGDTLFKDDPVSRPYLKENIRKIIETAPEEEYHRVVYLVRHYGMEHVLDEFDRELYARILEHYKQHGNCDLPDAYRAFYRYYHESDVLESAELYTTFRDHYIKLLNERTTAYLTDKKRKIQKGAVADTLFGDIMEPVRRCPLFSTTSLEQFETFAQTLFDKILAERPKKLFGIFG